MSGIGVQQGVLLAFIGLMITFHVRALREGKTHDTRWQPLLYALYGALTLITVRAPLLFFPDQPTNIPLLDTHHLPSRGVLIRRVRPYPNT